MVADQIKFVIYNPFTKLFDFFCESLVCELSTRNINCIVINTINELNINNESDVDINANNDIKTNKLSNVFCSTPQLININSKKDIILILINPHFINDHSNIKAEIMNIRDKFKYKILYLSEPINFIIEHKVNTDLINLIKPFCLWTYTYENLNKLKTFINIYKIFPSYNEAYNFTEINYNSLKSKNDQNIVFLGNINENRINICNKFGSLLINKTDSWTKEEWTTILKDNLFYLNIHRRNNCKSFESFRIIPILANGGVVFSERTNIKDEEVYKNYNIIFCEKNDIYDIFQEYISNIDYNMILKKTIDYRNHMKVNKNIDDFIDLYYKISK